MSKENFTEKEKVMMAVLSMRIMIGDPVPDYYTEEELKTLHEKCFAVVLEEIRKKEIKIDAYERGTFNEIK